MQLMNNCSNDTNHSPREICNALSPLHLQENCISLASLTGMAIPKNHIVMVRTLSFHLSKLLSQSALEQTLKRILNRP